MGQTSRIEIKVTVEGKSRVRARGSSRRGDAERVAQTLALCASTLATSWKVQRYKLEFRS